jgi:hypothetical protein
MEALDRDRNDPRVSVFEDRMATNVQPVPATPSARSAWRRALNVAVVVALVVASVAAQALDLTPVAILLLVAAVCALAPLFSPTIDV